MVYHINWFAYIEGTCITETERVMAPHFSTLAWKIPWMKETGRLQSMGSQRVGHDWATSFSFSLSCIGEGNGNPLQCSCLENPRDGRAWWASIYGVSQSQTRLKWLSNSSSILGINLTWSWCMIFLMCCWILFTKILLRIFASMLFSGIVLYVSFLCLLFSSGFGIRVIMAS